MTGEREAGGVAAAEVVIVGGGHAGMLAVRALLGHAGKITVIERDRYPDGPVFRAGVPQARHLHNLVCGGHQALDALLPGVMSSLAEAGARRLAPARDVVVHTTSGWHRRFAFTTFPIVSCTRPLIDFVIRTRVLAEAARSGTTLEVLEGAEVTGLLGTGGRVTGVRARRRGGGQRGTGQREREITADLVVDASGRGSRAPAWFQSLGLPTPAEETVDARLAYATRVYRFADEPDDGVLIQSESRLRRGGVLMPVEGVRWILMLAGFTGIRPPTDEDAFLEYAATLPHPYLHRLMRSAEPLSPVYGFLDTSNRYRRYARRGASPDGFVAVGDAVAAFNPVYGHGLTSAALQALALREVLAATGLRPG